MSLVRLSVCLSVCGLLTRQQKAKKHIWCEGFLSQKQLVCHSPV